MRHTQSLPTCPQCGATVHRTHTCRVSGLTRHSLPERPDPEAPRAAPLSLVTMPPGFRELAAAELLAERAAQARRDAMHVVDAIDLANAEAQS